MSTPPPLPPPLPDPADRRCPYQGLQPFTEEDREYFFGREEDQETIVANLIATPLSVLYGASGVGKSSVLLAGVVPLLRQTPRLAVVVFRSWQHADPLAALKREARLALGLSDTDPSMELDPIVRFDKFILQACRKTDCRLIFIFDQFEEYFLYHPLSDEEVEFDAAFARTVNRNDTPAHFLLSLREDSLSKLDRFQGRIPILLNTLLRLEHLDRAGAVRAIRKPLEVYNAKRPPEQHIGIEDALVEAVLDQVQTGRVTLGRVTEETTVRLFARSRPASCVETPFLQMVLVRLWQTEVRRHSAQLRKTTLEELEGAQKIVRTHLDEAMIGLAPADRGLAASVFHYMVTPSGMKIAYTVEDLAAYGGRSADELRPVLEKLCGPDLRILRKVSPPPEQPQIVRYEIYHDVLAAAVLDWRSRFLAEEQQRRQKALEEQLLRERAEARKQLAWLPWLVGFLADLFLCLPVGAFITTSMLRSRNSTLSRKRLFSIRVAWCLAWVPTIVLYVSILGVAAYLLGAGEETGTQQQEVSDFVMGLIAMVLRVPQVLAGPLVGWFVYRRNRSGTSPDPESLEMQPPTRTSTRSFLWLPWLMGLTADMFLCLPAGAWVSGAMVGYHRPGQFREAVFWSRITWIATWAVVAVSYLYVVGISIEDEPEGTALTQTDLLILAGYGLRSLVAPLAGWTVFRWRIRHRAPDEAPSGAMPPVLHGE